MASTYLIVSSLLSQPLKGKDDFLDRFSLLIPDVNYESEPLWTILDLGGTLWNLLIFCIITLDAPISDLSIVVHPRLVMYASITPNHIRLKKHHDQRYHDIWLWLSFALHLCSSHTASPRLIDSNKSWIFDLPKDIQRLSYCQLSMPILPSHFQSLHSADEEIKERLDIFDDQKIYYTFWGTCKSDFFVPLALDFVMFCSILIPVVFEYRSVCRSQFSSSLPCFTRIVLNANDETKGVRTIFGWLNETKTSEAVFARLCGPASRFFLSLYYLSVGWMVGRCQRGGRRSVKQSWCLGSTALHLLRYHLRTFAPYHFFC